MTAKKFDKGKPQLSMINMEAMIQEAKVLEFGAIKYGRENWKQGIEEYRLLDAALRHLFAYIDGEKIDPESGLSHIAHARAGLGFLLYNIKQQKKGK